MGKLRAFIGSSAESQRIALAAQENLSAALEVTVWSQNVFEPSSFTLDTLVERLRNADIAIFVFAPDDALLSRSQLKTVARDNVLLEFGIALGCLGRDRSFILKPNHVAVPSDLLGLVTAEYDGQREDENWVAALAPACTKILAKTQGLSRNPSLSQGNTYPSKISCTKADTDWRSLLEGAERVILSVLYVSDNWNLRFRSVFSDFLDRGGKLDVYLPALHTIHSLYGSATTIGADLRERILSTAKMFYDMNIHKRGDLRLVFLSTGFSYMFARTIGPSGGRDYIISPFPNDYSRRGSPVFQMREAEASDEMRAFIDREVQHVTSVADTLTGRYEKRKYIVWREDRRRVFVSSALSCPAGCKFCYVPSLVARGSSPLNGAKALQMAADIVVDRRFVAGPKGTTILLGAFSDPLHPQNLEATREILQFLRAFGNFVHIATRYPGPEDPSDLADPNQNLVLNFSLSSLDHGIEVDNVTSRFEGAQRFAAAGFNTALFLRPVIADYTVQNLNCIVEMSKAAGINAVTIGGLYIDERIRRRLKEFLVNGPLEFVTKDFVLDDQKVLRKLALPDIDHVYERFRHEGFETFLSSDQRIEYFENTP